ncbi:MAG: hypothetical protein V1799_06085 [bacterium]
MSGMQNASFLLMFMFGLIGCQKTEMKTTAELQAKINRFAPVEITADVSRLSEGDRKALEKLIAAANLMDKLYLRQAWSKNDSLLQKLEVDQSPEGKLRLRYYWINMGPWSDLDKNEPFIEGVPTRPDAANFYPGDLTKEEFTRWLASLSKADQEKAIGYFSTIRRDVDGKLRIVPYNDEYSEQLKSAAQLLREAAELTTDAGLKHFLSKRADAFLSNDYYESDVAWMELNSPLEPTIGPYEVYMDGLFNYKAAFEAFITLRNNEETKKLEMFSSHLQEIENLLPIEAKYRNPKLGALAPIRVVDEVYVGGEAKAGVQTAAFNLPNDERITKEKGSKRVMLKNVQEAKFEKVLVPISQIVITREQVSKISFETFFTHILAHELMHGLGPHTITVNGQQTTVRQAMKELSSSLEEAKADISGLFMLQTMIDKGYLSPSLEETMYVTYLASSFRTLRFGTASAHAKGMALQFTYLMDEGAFEYQAASGTWKVQTAKMKEAVKKLTGEIMTIQAEGSYEKAKALLDRYSVIRPEIESVLKKLLEIPTDIAPAFPLAAH